MKKLITILFILAGYFAEAQLDTSLYTPMNAYGYKWKRSITRYVKEIPQDTIYSKTGIARIGHNLYVGNDIYWKLAGVSLGPDDDSVTIHWPFICVWESGYPYACANLALEDTIVTKYPLYTRLKETTNALRDTLLIKGSGIANQYLAATGDTNQVEWKTLPGGSGGVESVTGDFVDNTDPLNPIINNPPIVTETSFTWSVLDSLNTPPVSPSTGDIYEISHTGATGAWATHEKEITTWDGGAWTFEVPSAGNLIFRVSNDIVSKYTTVWLRVGRVPALVGGNTGIGAPMKIGPTDAQVLQLITNGVSKMQITASGIVTITNLAGIGTALVGVNAAGTLSRVAGGGTTSEQPLTAIDGQTDFTFTSLPASYDDYIIFINGLSAESTTDYTASGNVVTLIVPRDADDRVLMRRIK